MPNTTLTTNVLMLDDGSRYRPLVVRAINLTSLVTGTTSQSALIDTASYRGARAYYVADGISTDSTVTIVLRTGPNTDTTETVFTSSGHGGISLATTGRGTRSYCGLNRWSRVSVDNSGAGEATGIAVDLELV